MAGEREAEAVEAVKQARRRVGFAVEPPVQKRLRLSEGWQKVIADAFAQGTRDLVAKLTATNVERAERTVGPALEAAFKRAGEDLMSTWRGARGDDLRKRAAGSYNEAELAAAYAKGRDVGMALVAAIKRGTAATRAAG